MRRPVDEYPGAGQIQDGAAVLGAESEVDEGATQHLLEVAPSPARQAGKGPGDHRRVVDQPREPRSELRLAQPVRLTTETGHRRAQGLDVGLPRDDRERTEPRDPLHELLRPPGRQPDATVRLPGEPAPAQSVDHALDLRLRLPEPGRQSGRRRPAGQRDRLRDDHLVPVQQLQRTRQRIDAVQPHPELVDSARSRVDQYVGPAAEQRGQPVGVEGHEVGGERHASDRTIPMAGLVDRVRAGRSPRSTSGRRNNADVLLGSRNPEQRDVPDLEADGQTAVLRRSVSKGLQEVARGRPHGSRSSGSARSPSSR